MFQNILIIGHSNIGDACYNAVVAAPLQEQFPQARISILTSSRTQNIFQGYTGIHKIFLFDTYAKDKGLFGYLRLIRVLRKEKFDLAVVLNSTLLYKFLGIPRVWSVREYLGRRPCEVKKHIADIYLEFLKAKGVSFTPLHPESHSLQTGDEWQIKFESTRKPRPLGRGVTGFTQAKFCFNLSEQEKSFAGDFLKEQSVGEEDILIGILPVAAWSLKSWPIEKWNESAKILKSRYGAKLIALGKSGDDSFSREVLKNMSSDIIGAIDKTSLKQAMAILKRCKLFIAPDSSLLHLASCMGVETIGLYGATSAEYIYPYFHRANMIVSKAALKCMPCYPGNRTAVCKKEFQPGECMEGISVEDLLNVVEAKLHRANYL